MELEKNVYINSDKIINNTKIKISYSGNLLLNKPTKIYCHYGYGNNWENTQDLELFKTDTGFSNNLYIDGIDSFNFCFHDGYGHWDNNDGNNYSFEIQLKDEIDEQTSKNVKESIKKDLSLITIDTSYFEKVKLIFNKLFKKIPNFFKRLAKDN